MHDSPPTVAAADSAPLRVLVVDDEPLWRHLHSSILSEPNYQITEAVDGESALGAIRQQDFDVVLLDKVMPGLDGDEVCRQVREHLNHKLLPIIMVTGVSSAEELAKSLDAGASDYIEKPFSAQELIARVDSAGAQKRVTDRLDNSETILFTLARMVEARDWHTGRHCSRLAHNAAIFGKSLGLATEELAILRRAGVLHDIGKLAIPDSILLKTGSLTNDQWALMRRHPVMGERLCAGLNSIAPVLPTIRHHHERWDGSGYPDALKGEDIPFLARVFQMVDIYDALASSRPYKRTFAAPRIVEIIADEAARGWRDPELTEAFLRILCNRPGDLEFPEADDDRRPEPVESDARVDIPDDCAGAHSLDGGTSYRSISKHPSVEEQLKRLRQRTETLLRDTAMGVFGLDPAGNVMFVNPAAASLLGYSECELLGTNHHAMVHASRPDGKPYPEDACPMHRSLHEGITIRDEEAFCAKDGSSIPVEFTSSPLWEAGGVAGVVVTFLDISERKANEDRLRQASSVFQNTSEGILVTDAEARIVAVNRAFSEVTGYSEAEVKGRNPRLLQSGRHDKGFYKAMWTSIEHTGRWRGEIWNRGKAGQPYPEWLTITAVKNPRGEADSYVAVFSDISDLKRTHERFQHLAHHDLLTNLPNRTLFNDRLKNAIRHAQRGKYGLALLYTDLDRFKTINDSLGHSVGDRLLIKVAQRIKQRIRDQDTVARLGGDEFIVLLDRIGTPADAVTVADKILGALAQPIAIDGQSLFAGASIGISLFPDDGDDSETLTRNADAAMYAAKHKGRNNYQFYTPEMTAAAMERITLESALRQAIERDEMAVFFQPQINLETGALTGAEALLRWRHATLGSVAPDRFIPLAESTGVIESLGEWVLRTACAQCRTWRDRGLPLTRMAVNVSGVQLRRGRMVETVRQVLEETGLEPGCLELEITEGFIMEQAEYGIEVLRELKALGVQLAIDDFGTGYSSLNRLKRLPIDRLKIDRTFIRNLPDDTDDQAITRAVIAMAKSLRLQITAEGVETEMQKAFLLAEGCQEAQGYLYSPAAAGPEFERFAGHGNGAEQGP